ncbi:hypothetical protein WMY93_010939 [Mugilogobius chulae]|uniref:Uncharacterized protein n=1 Tax=Mugilogobius chulae TaxID=88201 RepID=A0AAW0P938_9GOBI
MPNDLIGNSEAQLGDPDYTSSFPTSTLPPQASSYPPLPIADSSDASGNSQASLPPSSLDYPTMLASSPTLSPSSTTTPALQQTTFTFPTPPHSNSSSPQPLTDISPANSYHCNLDTPVDPSYQATNPACDSGLQDQITTLSHSQFQPVAAPPNTQAIANAHAPPSAATYPPVDLGAMPQFSSGAPYRSDIVRHHPSLLPQLDLPTAPPNPAVYSTFPSYH